MLKTVITDTRFRTLRIISTIAFLLILAIHNYFRPYGTEYSSLTKYWLGVLPNFFAGLGICLALYSTHLLKYKRFQTNKNQLFIASLVLPILMLIVWEYIQFLLGRTFDIDDIYMSLAGTMLGGFMILLFSGKKGDLKQSMIADALKD